MTSATWLVTSIANRLDIIILDPLSSPSCSETIDLRPLLSALISSTNPADAEREGDRGLGPHGDGDRGGVDALASILLAGARL